MTRRRWIADEVDLANSRAALIGEHAQHLARVLRAEVGQQFDLVCDGRVYQAQITDIERDRVKFSLGEEVRREQLQREITLLLSLFKFDRMEWAIEKAVELGVARIIPIVARRSEKHLVASAEKRVERWRRIAREAAEQSRRSDVPEIGAPVLLKSAIATQSASRIVLAEAGAEAGLRECLRNLGDRVAIAVGPEGGWTEDELSAFAQAGWQLASLGPTILRAETAAIAALAIISAE